MIRRMVLWFACVLAGIAVLLSASGPLEAGANSGHKIAIHVVAHGLACKSLPTFTECSQITTTYSGTGDIDVVPVFFNLSEYRVVEFGLTWPAEWGSCEYTKCTPTLDIGGITNPGDGMASAWTTCQTGWYVRPGYGWLSATGAGSVAIVPNAATGDRGVVDCAESPGPYYDNPETTFVAGVGGVAGGDPCGGGGRDGGGGLVYTLTIAPGNYLFIYGHEFHGDVVCRLEPGDSLRIGGFPVLPRCSPPKRVFTERELQEAFGQVPFIREQVAEGKTWNEASEAYWQQVTQTEASASKVYLREVGRMGSREIAVKAALDSLDRSLLDPEFKPEVTGTMIKVKLAGLHGEQGFELGAAPHGEAAVEQLKVVTKDEAMKFLQFMSRVLGGERRGSQMVVLTHNDTILTGAGVAKALKQIEESEKGNSTRGPLSPYELDVILAVRRGALR